MKRVTTGPCEHEEMSVQFSVDDKSILASTTQEYRDFVYRTLGKPTTAIQTTTPTTTSATSSQGEDNGKGNKESNKESGSKKSSKKSSSKSQEEVTQTSSDSSSEEMEEVASPFTKTETEASSEPSKEEKKSKKTKADEGIAYDCDNTDHKSTLTNFLTKLTGGKEWAKDKERSRKISREVLHGQPFMAKDGSILPSFSEICKNQYGVTTDVL